jgi:cell division initiation protein
MNEAKRLTVLEIETKKFRRRWRGYDPAAVDAFLQQVAAHYEEVLTENHQLREELIGLREEVQRYRTHGEHAQGVAHACPAERR